MASPLKLHRITHRILFERTTQLGAGPLKSNCPVRSIELGGPPPISPIPLDAVLAWEDGVTTTLDFSPENASATGNDFLITAIAMHRVMTEATSASGTIAIPVAGSQTRRPVMAATPKGTNTTMTMAMSSYSPQGLL